jgi:hypothetical protein
MNLIATRICGACLFRFALDGATPRAAVNADCDSTRTLLFLFLLPGSHSRSYFMAVTVRALGISPEVHRCLREAADAALEGDWRITLLQSHIDGQWNLQLEGDRTRYRVVISSLNRLTVAGLRTVFANIAAAEP